MVWLVGFVGLASLDWLTPSIRHTYFHTSLHGTVGNDFGENK